jgi:hypothetical protein
MVSAMGLTSPEQVDALLDGMERWHGGDDPWLRVWGVKFGLDGLEAGATEEPYADSHGHGEDFCGMVLWEPDALEQTPGSHEVCFTHPASLAEAFLKA